MGYRLLADTVVLVHLGYVVFVLAGALLVRRWALAAVPHAVAAGWGAYVALAHRVCPLTPLEVSLRVRAGDAGYTGGFVEHYLIPVLYPAHLTAAIQTAEGVLVVAVNAALYAWVWRVRQRLRAAAGTDGSR